MKLKLDVDFKDGIREFIVSRGIVMKWISNELKLRDVEVYETKRGFHFYVDLDYAGNLNGRELHWYTVALQAVLGSDFKREALNIKRVAEGEINWNVLFQEKRSFDGKLKGWERKTRLAESLEELIKKEWRYDYDENK